MYEVSVYPLQFIIFAESSDSSINLYSREVETYFDCGKGVEYRKVISFDTYFNCFSIKKWKDYTSLSNLSLVVKATGSFRIELYELKRDNTEKRIAFMDVNSQDLSETVLAVPHTEAQMVFFRILYSAPIAFDSAWWATSDAPTNDIHLSAAICTFKKEAYVYRNVEKFKVMFTRYPELLQHFRIYIVDNGQSLDMEKIDCPNTRVFPNINAGGAGGFARGMIEILRDEAPSTHILVMDDDIEIVPNSIYLSLSLLSYLKPEYQRHFIGGAMLNIMYRNVKTASVEWFKTSKTAIGSIGEQNLNFRNEILISDFNSVHEKQYQAWWYCIIPTTVVGLDNLPFPLFFRHDDIDFSFRNKAKIILMNGICVWHEPFYKKQSVFPDYIQLRNMLALSSVDKHLSEKSVFALIWKRFLCEVRTFNYRSAHAYPDAIEHVLQGPDFFMNPDNCAYTLKNGLARNEKFVPITQIENCTDYMNYYTIQNTNRIRGLKKVFWEYFLNGHLLPFLPCKASRGVGWHTDYAAHNFYRRKSMVVVDPVNGMAAIRERSQKEMWAVMRRMIFVTWKYLKTRKELRKAYAEKYPYMTSVEFWDKYLGINK